jgi:uncharacterized membrane protein
MVQLDLFENSITNQVLRTLLALAIIVPCDMLYLKLSEKSLDRLWKNWFAYFNVWITLALVFGVSLLTTNTFKVDEVNNDTIKNYVNYGLLIGLLVYVPLYNWIISCGAVTGFSHLLSLANITFGVILSAFTCLLVFLISVKTNLIT